MNAIVGSLVRNGYLNSISSAIMISVEDKDTARAEKLQRELTSAVDGALQTSEAKAAVLTQTLTQDAAREQQARENSISSGKAALVNRVLAINPALKFDALAKLSVEELKDLAEAGAPAMPIGKDAAAYAAEQYAGTTALNSVTAEVDSELDEFPAHYEVELHTAWGEFEYLVDAYTGKVLSGQKDLPATAPVGDETAKPIAPTGDIGQAKAKSIALNHAGVSENKAYDMEIELDDEDGTLVYEVEFKSAAWSTATKSTRPPARFSSTRRSWMAERKGVSRCIAAAHAFLRVIQNHVQNGGLVGDFAVGVGGVALKADAFARLNDDVFLISRDFDCTGEKGDKLGGTRKCGSDCQWLVLSAYGDAEFSTKRLEKDFGVRTPPTATIRSFVLKFEKLGLLKSMQYGNRVKYAVCVC